MNSTRSTFGVSAIARRSAATSASLAPCLTKTSTTTRARTSFAVPVVAWTIGMKTPSTSAVSSTQTVAARLGAALRDSARSASLAKKPRRAI
jgi:hypothetical protein